MASSEEVPMRKQLRVSRRRQKHYVKLKNDGHSCDILSVTQKNLSPANKGHNIDSDQVYLVETIRGERIIKGQKYYKVRWQGFPPEADSWEPEKNLSSVLDIIADFQRRSKEGASKAPDLSKDYQTTCANSPASVPTPPATPSSSLSSAHDRSRGASEDRQLNSSSKRKLCAKSRNSGRFEYVPKHELVASKTKYFDDIRDGKIDLSSNDLYSRVKTRKRCAAEAASNSTGNDSANSRNGSLHGETETECDTSLEPFTNCSIKQEPNSPSSGSFDAGDSTRDLNSLPEAMELMQPHLSPTEKIEQSTPSGTEKLVYSQNSSGNYLNDMILHNSKSTQFNSPSPQSVSIGIICDMQSNEINKSDACLSPIHHTESDSNISSNNAHESSKNHHQNVCDNSKLPYEISSIGMGQTVSSLRALVNIYFHLISSYHSKQLNNDNSTNDHSKDIQTILSEFESLPKLCIYNPHIRIQTHQELLEAINNQRWGLVATVPPSDLLSFEGVDCNQSKPANNSCSTSLLSGSKESKLHLDMVAKEEILLACITGGAGRPLIMDYLLNCGLDPDKIIDPNTKWPLLALAVHLGRLNAAQALLDAGAKPNCCEPGAKQRSALGLAISAGNVDMASMLILAGANFYEVEPGTTALKLIMKLLQSHTSNQSAYKFVNNGQLNKSCITMAEIQDRLRSTDSQFPPLPVPHTPDGFNIPSIPKSIIFNALMNYNLSSTNLSCTSQLNSVHANNHSNKISVIDKAEANQSSNYLPSVDSLCRLYELVAAHHARLSMSVTNLVRGWLTRADLIQVGLISPCQWINIKEHIARTKFTWPNNEFTKLKSQSTRLVAPILILVHGRIAPPACYDLWMDDDGPCLIERVCLDQVYVQKPLSRLSFVTTLFPLDFSSSKSHEHEVSIEFKLKNSNFKTQFSNPPRPTCIAVMIIAVALGHTHDKDIIVQSNNISTISQPHRPVQTTTRNNSNSLRLFT